MTDTQHNALVEQLRARVAKWAHNPSKGSRVTVPLGELRAVLARIIPVPLADEQMEERAREVLAETYEYQAPRRAAILAGAVLDRSERRAIRAMLAFAREVATHPAESVAADMREAAAKVTRAHRGDGEPMKPTRWQKGWLSAATAIERAIRALPLKAGQEGEGR